MGGYQRSARGTSKSRKGLAQRSGGIEIDPEDYAAESQAEAALGELVFGGEAPDEGTPEPGGDTEAPDEGPAEQPTPQLWAGKYKTAEDLEKAYSELQSKLGEQGSELGQEVQRLRDELGQIRQQQAAPSPQPTAAFDEDTYEDLLDENPQQALAYAQQAGDSYRAAAALKAWFDVDAYSATEWRLAQERQVQAAQFQQQTARYEQEVGNQQLTRAFASVKAQHQDFDALEAKMSEVANLRPDLIERLAQPGEQNKEQVIESLYYIARGMMGGSPVEPTGATPEEAPHVATAQTVPPGQPRPRNPILDGLREAAEEMSPAVFQNWGQIPGR